MIVKNILIILILLIAPRCKSLACTFTGYSVDANAYSGYAVDLDNDTDIDVVTLSSNSDTVKWYQNNGSQSFTGININTAYTWPYVKPYPVDIDADGDMDILSTDIGVDEVTLWRSNGAATPTFTRVVIERVTAPAYKEVAAADFDGDGDLDIVASRDIANNFSWYKQDASHNFGARIDIANIGAVGVEAVDLDDDGDKDIVITSFGDGTVYWFRNNGTGTFTQFTIYTSSGSVPMLNPLGLDVADLDGDGDKDIAVAASSSSATVILRNNGSEIFTASTAGYGNFDVEAADLDNDGDMDLATSGLRWLRNNGSGTFTATTTAVISAAGELWVDTEDVDKDGLVDIVSGSKWWKNTCSATGTNKVYFAP